MIIFNIITLYNIHYITYITSNRKEDKTKSLNNYLNDYIFEQKVFISDLENFIHRMYIYIYIYIFFFLIIIIIIFYL